ncbi:hypothetical protein DIPPA_22489 [Diplonema papillatum]|nr:hypothetical protein DIPPA_08141 [Diplonema papillatum]KAJ9459643.1 hypothetical protein DIPPA_22489 [Diplonema papillatum]
MIDPENPGRPVDSGRPPTCRPRVVCGLGVSLALLLSVATSWEAAPRRSRLASFSTTSNSTPADAEAGRPPRAQAHGNDTYVGDPATQKDTPAPGGAGASTGGDECAPGDAVWPSGRVVVPIEYNGNCTWTIVRPEDIVQVARHEKDVQALTEGRNPAPLLKRSTGQVLVSRYYRTRLASGAEIDLVGGAHTDDLLASVARRGLAHGAAADDPVAQSDTRFPAGGDAEAAAQQQARTDSGDAEAAAQQQARTDSGDAEAAAQQQARTDSGDAEAAAQQQARTDSGGAAGPVQTTPGAGSPGPPSLAGGGAVSAANGTAPPASPASSAPPAPAGESAAGGSGSPPPPGVAAAEQEGGNGSRGGVGLAPMAQPAGGVADLFRALSRRVVRWEEPSPRAESCLRCGYSCSQFQHFPGPAGLPYPVVDRPPLFVVCGGRKNAIDVYNHAANPVARETAIAQGWAVYTKEGPPPEGAACASVVELPTVFFRRRFLMNLAQSNMGHYLHDVLFPMFMTVYNHVGLEAMHGRRYRVVPEGDGWDEGPWRRYWAIGFPGTLLSAVFPKEVRETLSDRKCFRRAVFDCPAVLAMHPTGPFHAFLERELNFRFAPLRPLPPAAPLPGTPAGRRQLSMLMMVRCVGGSRYLSNWAELQHIAQVDDFRVTVETRNVYATFREALLLYQNSHVLAGIHGAELCGMLFMPTGSVVIEVVPQEYRYLDAWYVRQSNASKLHHLRITPAAADVKYLRYGAHKACGRKFAKAEANTYGVAYVYEAGYRQLASTVRLDPAAWATALQFARAAVTQTFPTEQAPMLPDQLRVARS